MFYKTGKGKEIKFIRNTKINYPKNNKLQENIIYLKFSFNIKTTKALLNSIIFKKNTII